MITVYPNQVDINPDSTTEISTANSTTTPLASGATFTGVGELNGYANVAVYVETDVQGTVFFEYSSDGVNYEPFPFNGFRVGANIIEFHTDVKAGRYFRVRYHNNGTTQSFLRLQTYYGNNFRAVTTPLNQRAGRDYDAMMTRPTDFGAETSLGLRSGHAIGRILGRNSDVDRASDPEDLWNGGGLYTGFQPTANENISVASSDVNDTGSDVSTGTATGGSQTTIEDSSATFVTDGVAIGDAVVNVSKGSHGIVKAVTSETELEVYRMDDLDPIGTNTNASGDSYRVVTATSTGAGLIRIGPILNSDYELQTPVYVTLNGTTTVTTVGVDAFRFSFAQVIIAGSSENNEGDITARQAVTTANIMFVMPDLTGQTEVAAYTVPAGQRMLLKNIHIALARTSGAAGSATVYIQEIPAGGPRRTIRVYEVTNSSSVNTLLFGAIVVQEKTDVVVRVETVSDDNTLVESSLEYILVAIG